MDNKRLVRFSVSVMVALCIAAPVMAGEPTEQIKQTTDKILAILSDPAWKPPAKKQERRALVRKTVDERFDWEEMARRALSRHWAQRTPEEKKEFVRLFSDLVDQTYMDKVEGYTGEKVLYDGDSIDKDYGSVKVKILTTTNREIPVEYRVLKKGTAWLVYDIAIEGISLISNYRSQFNSILAKSSFKDLVEKLRAKSVQ